MVLLVIHLKLEHEDLERLIEKLLGFLPANIINIKEVVSRHCYIICNKNLRGERGSNNVYEALENHLSCNLIQEGKLAYYLKQEEKQV